MAEPTAREKIRAAIALARWQAIQNKLTAACHVDKDGTRIRGVVGTVVCAGCKHRRWDDGTPCKQITHGGRVCGHRVKEDEDRMEEGRLD